MLKKLLAVFLALIMLLSILCGCGAKQNSAQNNSTTTTEKDELKTVSDLALLLGNAVMVYDLQTIMEHSALSLEESERILADVLPYAEDGTLQWEGNTYESYEDFVKGYDAVNNKEYQKLEIELTDVKIMGLEASNRLNPANERERLYRSQFGATTFSHAVARLKIDKIAIATLRVCFQNADSVGVNGATNTAEEQTGTIIVYMVQIGGQWKSYSPTICGTFPPQSHFNRYVTVNNAE